MLLTELRSVNTTSVRCDYGGRSYRKTFGWLCSIQGLQSKRDRYSTLRSWPDRSGTRAALSCGRPGRIRSQRRLSSAACRYCVLSTVERRSPSVLLLQKRSSFEELTVPGAPNAAVAPCAQATRRALSLPLPGFGQPSSVRASALPKHARPTRQSVAPAWRINGRAAARGSVPFFGPGTAVGFSREPHRVQAHGFRPDHKQLLA